MVARPPTSAVLGRSDIPARRTAWSLLTDAAVTRAFRPTVFTAASKLSRTDISPPAAVRAAAPRDGVTLRVGVGVAAVVPRVVVRADTVPVAGTVVAVPTSRRTVVRDVLRALPAAAVAVVRTEASASLFDADDGNARDIAPESAP